MDIYTNEETDGVRMSWNLLPPNEIITEKLTLPPAILYTPFKEIENLDFLGSSPIRCTKCRAIVNPYCTFDTNQWKTYRCSICNNLEQFTSAHSRFLNEGNQLPEISNGATTVEYLLSQDEREIGYIFVIDKVLPKDELNSLKHGLLESIKELPDEVHVGLVSYDSNVFLHDLEETSFLSEKAINGAKEYDRNLLASLIGVGLPAGAINQENFRPSPGLRRYIKPLSECRDLFNRVVNSLTHDRSFVDSLHRPNRATGSALKTAITLASGWYQDGIQIINFIGGPCTHGSGSVVPTKKEWFIRSFAELQSNTEKIEMSTKAYKFYDSLAKDCISANASVSLFAFTCDQFGYYEMRSLIRGTGGFIVTHEEFKEDVFLNSLKQFFRAGDTGFTNKGFGTKIEMSSSKGLYIKGALGCCRGLGLKGENVSSQTMGEGGTSSWYIGTVDPNSTICFMLDSSEKKEKNLVLDRTTAYIQFRTYYKHACGQLRLRVTTIKRLFGGPNREDYISSFDQEAAIISMSRQCMAFSSEFEPREIMKLLDKKLVQMYHRFGRYNRDQPKSFVIHDEMNLLAQFFYFVRKSTFIFPFSISIDEMEYRRSLFNRENISNSLMMIQPSLVDYNMESEHPTATNCDLGSLKADSIILFDSFFNVVIWHGKTIAEWRKQNYQNQEGFEYFKDLLEMPTDDANYVMEERFPAPKLTICDQGHQDERLIKSKLNPGDGNIDNETAEKGECITDDKSLLYFTQYLVGMVVKRDTDH